MITIPTEIIKIGKIQKKINNSTSQVFHPETETAQLVDFPEQYNNEGKYLTTNGSTLAWATVDALPSQSGNTGKYLYTDGSDSSWADLPDFLLRSGGTLTGNIYGRPVVGSSATATGDDLPVLFVSKDNTLNKGDTLDKARYFTLGAATDATGSLTNEHKFGQVQVSITTAGKISTELIAYRNTANNGAQAKIAISQDKNGNVSTEAPTPATADNSTKIATTAFVKAQGYINSSGSITGNAATATKLGTSDVGSDTQPIYLSGGVPTATTYTLGKSVPSNAVFTDTTYTNGTGLNLNDNTFSLKTASSSVLGGVKIGDGITITDGVISADSQIPSQTNNSGKYLTTNGSSLSWSSVNALPSQTGNSGKFLTTNGTAASWATVDALPSQTNNSGKYLTTDGTSASWNTIPTYSTFVGSGSTAASGLVPAPSTTAGTTKYLREDGSWEVPPNDNTVTTVTTTGSGNAVTSITDSNGAITVTKGDSFVDLSTDQTVAGTKTFSNVIISETGIIVKDDRLQSTVRPVTTFDGTSTYAQPFEYRGPDDKVVSMIYTPFTRASSSSWSNSIQLLAYDVTQANAFARIGVGYNQNGVYTIAPTPALNDNSTQIATTAWVKSNLSSYAPLASPTFTGTPKAPTASASTNNTQIATTAFVKAQGYITSSGSITGNAATATTATTATKLGTTDVGSATQPIYLDGGVPTATTYTLGKSVPSDAVFTDTIYTHPTTSGNKHIPSGGSTGQFLKWSADGTAVWAADNNTTYSAGDGLSLNSTTFSLDTATASTIGGVKIGNGITITDGVISADSQIPTQTNNGGKYLTTDGSDLSWATVDALPSQTGNSGKFLSTNGTTASWTTVFSGEVRVSSTHYPSAAATTIVLTADQVPESNVEQWGLSVYRDGIYLVDGIDYTYASNSRTLTFTRAFEADEVVSVNFAYLSSDSGTSGSTTLPTQTGQSGKFLTTNGIDASWSTLPIATTSVLGAVKVGNNLSINSTTGVLSATDQLPSQTSNSGKFLTTNGTTASWATVNALPSQSGNSGKYLTTNGSDASWATVDALPSQTGNSGKYLTTNGSSASWETITSYTLPTASDTTLGGVKVGTNLSINANGVLSATDTVYTHPTTSGNKHIPSGGSTGQFLKWSADGTAVWAADNNTVTTVTVTGDGNAITDITDSNGALTATKGSTFSLSTHDHDTDYAAIDHNHDSEYTPISTSIGSATQGVYTDIDGVIRAMTYQLNKTVPADAVFTDTVYTLPEATTSELGGVIVGAGLSVTANGTLSADSQLPALTGNSGKYLTTNGTNVSWASISEYSLTKASTTELGGIKVGNRLSIDSNGFLSADEQLPTITGNSGKFLTTDGTSVSWGDTPEYTLPTASSSTLGGIKVGSGLSISSGVLSADDQLPTQTNNSGKYLTTNGTYASWANITVTGVTTTGSGNAVTSITDNGAGQLAAIKGLTFATIASPEFTGTPTAPTATAGNNSTQIATTAYVDGAISSLVNAAPATLDTLNELAEALGNDPDFATTVSTSLGNKLDSNSANYVKSLSISGKTITVTKGNNTTSTLTTQDTTYTQGTGITISNGVISANSQLPSQTNNAGKYLYTDGSSVSWENTPVYTLPEATTSNLGGVIVGNGLSVAADGTISVDDQLPVQTSNNGKYLTTNGTSASWASIPEYSNATTSAAGLMAPEDKTKLDSLSNYTLPIATASELGGVRVGTNLSIDSSTGILSATDTVTTATTSGSGNAVTAITASNGALTVTKGSTFSLSDHNHDSTYLKLTGGTITGNIYYKSTAITRGTAPASNNERIIAGYRDSANNSLGAISNVYYTDKSSFTGIWAYNTSAATGSNIGRLGIGSDSSGNVYTIAPTPPDGDASTKIATTAFISYGNANVKLRNVYSATNNRNNYPYHRIASTGVVTAGFQTYNLELLVTDGTVNYGCGILKITLRTNNVAGEANASCSARWLARDSSLPIDNIVIGFRNTFGDTIVDVFVRKPKTYLHQSIKVIANGNAADNGYSYPYTLYSATEVNDTTSEDKLTSTNVYSSIEAANAELYENKPYTSTITPVDAGIVDVSNKLGTSNVGSATQPIYLAAGVPTATTYTLGKSVPSDAVFTDTTYAQGTGITIDSNNVISANDQLPSQTGNSGKFLTTNGTTVSWANAGTLPSQTGNSGKFLTTDGTDASWETVDALPLQTNNEGKILVTDGTDAVWKGIFSKFIDINAVAGSYTVTIPSAFLAGEDYDSIAVYLAGVKQNSTYDYTLNTSTGVITFVDELLAGDVVTVGIFASTGFYDASDNDVQVLYNQTPGVLTSDGSNMSWKNFTKMSYVVDTTSNNEVITIPAANRTDAVATEVYRNGLLLVPSDDYTINNSTGEITFVLPIQANEKINVITQKVITGQVVNYTTATTQATSDNSTNVATTAYVTNKITSYGYQTASDVTTAINNRFANPIEKVIVLTSAASVTIDPNSGSLFMLSLSTNASISISTISNGPYTTNGATITLYLNNTNSTISWGNSITWISGSAPDVTTNPSIITFVTFNGGTTWYGSSIEIES